MGEKGEKAHKTPKAAKRAREEEEEAPVEAPATVKRQRADSGADSDAGEASAVAFVAPIAVPLAGKKLLKKTLKVVKKAAGSKILRRGVKEVVKALRKGEKGLVVMAADISPLDVLSHIPVLCEDSAVPFLFVTGKAELGAAAGTKRPTSVVLVTAKTAKGEKTSAPEIEKWTDVMDEVKALQPKA